jgi:hypothetical protein
MIANSNKTPWASVSLLFLSGFFSMMFLGIGFLMGIAGLFEIAAGGINTAESALSLSAGSIFLGLALLPAVYFSLMHVMNKPARTLPFHVFPTWAIVSVWVVSAALTVLLDSAENLPLVSIPFNLLTLILPVWILIRIALKGVRLESPELRWGTFALGMTIVPLLIGIAEVLVIFAAGVAAVFWIALNPDLINAIESLSARLMYTNNPEAISRILTPYIFNPLVITASVIFFSVIIPVIEELLKPLGVWLNPGRLVTPGQGFAAGVIGGGAYALIESLGISPGLTEASNLLSIVRAGTDLVHVLTSGLMGWALVSAWREKKYSQLGLTFLLVIVIHGIWNALALSSAAQLAIDFMPNPSQWVQNLPSASAAGLIVLTVTNFLLLVFMNRRLSGTTTPARDPSHSV